MDFGGGLNFGAFYGELRYHYIWGPEVELPPGAQNVTDTKANGQFLQATVGIRF